MEKLNPFVPTVAFSQLSSNICCPRDCASRHNGVTLGAPLKPLRDDSALRALSTLRGLRGAPEVPPLCRETQSLGQQMLNAPVGINGINFFILFLRSFIFLLHFFLQFIITQRWPSNTSALYATDGVLGFLDLQAPHAGRR